MEDEDKEYQAHEHYEKFQPKSGDTIAAHVSREGALYEKAKKLAHEGQELPEGLRAHNQMNLLDSCHLTWR